MWDFKNGLPPLTKPTLYQPIEIRPDQKIYSTGIDGFPYILATTEELNNTDKFGIAGQYGLYSLKGYDEEKLSLVTKIEKSFNLWERVTKHVKEYFEAWGMKKEAEKVKTNYRLGTIEFNIEGRLSKNQVVQCSGMVFKITDLIKAEDGIIDIYGDLMHPNILIPVFPYVQNGEIKDWYYDMSDVYLRQNKDSLTKGD